MTAELPGIAPVTDADQFAPGAEGVWYDLPAETYHAAPGVSQSALKHFEQSPAHYRAAMAAPRHETPALRFGHLTHTVILEPHLIHRMVVEPDRKRPTKSQIEAKKPSEETVALIKFWNEWDAQNRGKIVVSAEERDQLQSIRDAVLLDPIASKALDTDIRECSLFVKFEHNGGSVLRKARIDAVKGNALLDIKTTVDAREFADDYFKLRYYRQAAYYLDAWNDTFPNDPKEAFVFIAVEKEPPYGIMVFECDEEDINIGRREYHELLVEFIGCADSNTWPCYPKGIRRLTLPEWAKRKLVTHAV